jgi:rhodanese-related sulfurtransferase
VKSVDEYVELMNNLKLPRPKMMDVAVPANMKVGLNQEDIERRGWAVTASEALTLLRKRNVALIDLREPAEQKRRGIIPGSLQAPYTAFHGMIAEGGTLHELALSSGKQLLFYCAYGERSAMAVRAAQDAGLASTWHLAGGIAAWETAGGPVTRLKNLS